MIKISGPTQKHVFHDYVIKKKKLQNVLIMNVGFGCSEYWTKVLVKI